jgi:hypothetical protein
MEHRTLVVANRTASTPLLLEEIERRASQRPTAFVLLIPGHAGAWPLEDALKAIRRAASGPNRALTPHVEGRVGDGDPFEAVQQAIADGNFDDVIISTLSKRRSQWLRRDLPRRVEQLGVPVTVVTQPAEKRMGIKDLPLAPGPG